MPCHVCSHFGIRSETRHPENRTWFFFLIILLSHPHTHIRSHVNLFSGSIGVLELMYDGTISSFPVICCDPPARHRERVIADDT